MSTEPVIFVIAIAMLVGLATVVYVALRLVWAVLSGVFQAVGQVCGLKGGASAAFAAGGRRALVCPNADCRRVEHRDARYCPQCGPRFGSRAAVGSWFV